MINSRTDKVAICIGAGKGEIPIIPGKNRLAAASICHRAAPGQTTGQINHVKTGNIETGRNRQQHVLTKPQITGNHTIIPSLSAADGTGQIQFAISRGGNGLVPAIVSDAVRNSTRSVAFIEIKVGETIDNKSIGNSKITGRIFGDRGNGSSAG